MRKLGAEVIFVEGGYGDAEIAGLHYASNHSMIWISPYNDSQVDRDQSVWKF
jgi:threonine dehydratase